MFKNCAVCHEDHESFARTVNGVTHVYQDAETMARRSKAAVAFKIRANEAMGANSPNMRAWLAAQR